MTDLSPIAQAILTAQAKQRCLNEWDHVNDPPCHPSDKDWNGCYQCVDRRGLAAALRAVVDQLGYSNVPEEFAHLRPLVIDSDELLAIADELETSSTEKSMTDFLVQGPSQPLSNCITFNVPPTREMVRIDSEGFHYQGQFIADAGEAHRLMVEFLKQNTSAALTQAELEGANG